MESSKEGSIIVAKFVDGEIIENLINLAEKEGIDAGIFISGIGMLKNVEIGYFMGEKYKKERIVAPMELVSLQGNIGRGAGKVLCHVHVALAGEDHKMRGGHLFRGDVIVVNEIVLYVLKDVKIIRKENQLGLMEMVLEGEN
jgi:predicted DNA-binding protein with PD1-like motif